MLILRISIHPSRLGAVLVGIMAFLISRGVLAQEVPKQGIELSRGIEELVGKSAPKEIPLAELLVLRGYVGSASDNLRSERRFVRLENGLWGVTVVLAGRVTSIRRWLSFQGLLWLAGVGEIASKYESTTVVPFGRTFVPFSTVSDTNAVGSQNTTILNGELESLASPELGRKYIVEQTWVAVSQISSGFVGGVRTDTRTFTLRQSCTAEKEERASTLHQNLRGMYLLVVCEGGLDNGTARIDRFAYLRDSKLYVLLSSLTNGVGDVYTITEVEYAN